MHQSLTLRLAPFEFDALERYGSSQRVAAARVIHTAVMYYLGERDSDRPAWHVPPLRREEHESSQEVEVEVEEKVWRALAEQAAAQGVDSEQLAKHALLFFLADVDSGRAAARLERVVRPE
jgi:hypothetical protein